MIRVYKLIFLGDFLESGPLALLELGATDAENNIKLLHELAMVFELKDRAAHFHTTLVVASPEKESLVVEADWPGYINFEPKGENGFGYDPLFFGW